MVRRATITCIVVGALLTAINHGDALVAGQLDGGLASRIGLTFVIPYLVATISSALAIRRLEQG